MIEFMKDGAWDDASPEREETPSNPLLIGLGHAGISILDQFVIHGREAFPTWAIDTDQSTIEGSVIPEKKLLGLGVCRGLGCAGDLERARAIWKSEEDEILQRLAGADSVVLTVGLGGSTGAILAVEIARALRHREATTRIVVIAALPFCFESKAKQAQARQILGELRSHADAVLTFANDRVDAWSEARENIRRGLYAFNLSLAQAVESVAQLLTAGGMNAITFADVRSLFGRLGDGTTGENCWIGQSDGMVDEPAAELIDRVLQDPLLADPATWQQADSCLACIVGGHDFSIGQLKAISKALTAALENQMEIKIPVLIGARSIDRHEGRIALSILLASTRGPQMAQPQIVLPIEAAIPLVPAATIPRKAKAKPEPVIDLQPEIEPQVEREPEQVIAVEPSGREILAEAPQVAVATVPAPAVAKPLGKRAKAVKQEELPFEAGTRGRFENSFETIYKGENLDQPTFRRRRMTIKA